MCSNYEADITHPESRAGLATVQGWNRVRAADLFKPTPPHNSGMTYGLETENKQQHLLTMDPVAKKRVAGTKQGTADISDTTVEMSSFGSKHGMIKK